MVTSGRDIPGVEDVRAAALRLKGIAHRTPVLSSARIDELVGAHIFFKCENFQRMGAFKFRGAFNAVSQFPEHKRAGGVITYSSGNHAQAVALSASMVGVPATILMPRDAARVKIEATRGYGAHVRLYDRAADDREAMCSALVKEHGFTFVHPFDDPRVIAGQGTAAWELLEDVGELDFLFTALGGGGLLAGSALAAHALSPHCKVIGVEPESSDDGLQSMRAGHVVRILPPHSIAEGALGTHVGQRNFAVMQRHVHDVVTVNDLGIIRAMQHLAQNMKLVIEPTAALPLAALLTKVLDTRSARIGVVLSGGNVDLARYATLLSTV